MTGCAWEKEEKGGRQASNLDLCRTSSDQHTTTAVCWLSVRQRAARVAPRPLRDHYYV